MRPFGAVIAGRRTGGARPVRRRARGAAGRRPPGTPASRTTSATHVRHFHSMIGVNEIRRAFLDYFRAFEHEIVSSSPLVPRNDPTLMFTNAGMVQFK